MFCYQVPNDELFISVCCQYSCCHCGFFPQVSHINLSLLKLVSILQGATGVGSNLEIRSCPAGYRPSYFVLEGGKGVGRSIRESQAPLLCRSTPRALAKVWWSVRAQSCLPDLSASSMQHSNSNSAFNAHMHQVFLTVLSNEDFIQLVICSDIRCSSVTYWTV